MSDTQKLGIAGGLTRAFITSPLTPLFIIAALAVGIVALITLPREEEPQISVPLVDIHLQAPGLKAPDAVKLVTEPMETIVKGINGVEHVYSQTEDEGAMVTARFVVGTSSDAAILRVHDKIRANMERIPVGIPEPLIVGRGIDDVAIVSLTLSPKPGHDDVTANDLTRIARELRAEVSRWVVFCDDEVTLADLSPQLQGMPRATRRSAAAPDAAPRKLAEVVAQAETTAITAALDQHRGNLSRTARTLGIDRNTLKRKLARYAIERPEA